MDDNTGIILAFFTVDETKQDASTIFDRGLCLLSIHKNTLAYPDKHLTTHPSPSPAF